MDIQQNNTLQFRNARDNNDEKHICPLQLDVIERLITMYSNINDIIYDPFAGIGSTGYQALKMNRKFVGHELKHSYYNCMVNNLNNIIKQRNQIALV